MYVSLVSCTQKIKYYENSSRTPTLGTQVHKTLTEAESSFEKYWKVFLIGEANRRILDRYLRKVRGESDIRKSSSSEPLPVKPTFRLVYQPKVVSQDDNDDTKENNDVEEENEAECLTHSKMKMGSDIVILMHGVKATGRNWIGLYRVDEPD